MDIELLPSVIIIAAALSFFDAALGMGYGTSIIAILLLLGFSPLEAVPAVLLTNAVLGILAGFSHHKFDNVDFNTHTQDFKVMAALTGFGIVGVVAAISIAVRIPEVYLKAYIGALVSIIGALIILRHKSNHPFSWKKIISLGTLAAFNKGLSGGGYGPVIVGGQILSGVNSKSAIGIAALAEGLVSIVGTALYLLFQPHQPLDYSLIVSLLIGGTITVPIAAWIVQKYHPRKLRRVIGTVSLVLGLLILIQTFI